MSNFILKTIFFDFLTTYSLVSSNDREIEITANSMEWKKKDSIAIAIGDAKAIQGNNVLYANKIVVFFNKKKNMKTIKKNNA